MRTPFALAFWSTASPLASRPVADVGQECRRPSRPALARRPGLEEGNRLLRPRDPRSVLVSDRPRCPMSIRLMSYFVTSASYAAAIELTFLARIADLGSRPGPRSSRRVTGSRRHRPPAGVAIFRPYSVRSRDGLRRVAVPLPACRRSSMSTSRKASVKCLTPGLLSDRGQRYPLSTSRSTAHTGGSGGR